jgi:calcium-translocating P-type ATPase
VTGTEKATGARPGGLTTREAEDRLARHGLNQLDDEPPTHPLRLLVNQFRSPLIYILLVAAAVTVALDELVDAAVIAAVLVLNAAIGFVQERKAEGAVRALRKLVVPRCRVLRDGDELDVDSRHVVVGDVVILEPGTSVPADLRLVSSSGLQIDESLLTGESLPVSKSPPAIALDAPLADQTCMAFTGTLVTSGRARGIVVATGSNTELGAIADMIRHEDAARTPLQQRMSRFAALVGAVVGGGALLAFTSGVALGNPPSEMFLAAVALAVAAIPEGLPVAFTITLALGVHRMARRNAIVRRLAAVETLGSTTVICSDKTGTLTQNRMTVTSVWAGGRPYTLTEDALATSDGTVLQPPLHPILRAALETGVLTNEGIARREEGRLAVEGDPTETALLVAADRAGVAPERLRDEHPVVAEIPFEPELRYSASLREHGNRQVLHVKGAPERVLEMCTGLLGDDGVSALDADAVLAAAHALADRGQRVLALARGHGETPLAPGEGGVLDTPHDLELLGLQGMLDPARPGVADAIATCRSAGVRVVMVTGDHATTARAIARDLGITRVGDDEVLTGADLDRLDDEELAARCGTARVFARVSPDDKLRVVHAMRRRGEVVAVTGDGVNDAPALKAAAIGVAMGREGTDVAREASDMVLADDNFVSIAAAVEEGRVTFDNVRKVTFFLVSTGAATIAAILAGIWLQWPLMLLPAQLLWLNLVTNGLQDVALAFEPGSKEVLRRPPRRPGEGLVNRVLWERTALVGLVMAAGTLALFRWELDRGGSLQQARTVALTTLVIFMAFHAGNARSEHRSLLRVSPWSNPFLFLATVVAVSVHAAALHVAPTQFVLRVEPIDGAAWLRIVAVASTILVVVELHKVFRRRFPLRETARVSLAAASTRPSAVDVPP